MEIILQILAELFLQLIFEALAEVGIHQTKRRNQINPVLASIGYLTFGVILGGFSLLLFPESFIESGTLKLINLIATPIILGLIMLFIGKARVKKGKETVRIEKFAFGFLFAFGLALVRYAFTT